jgi:hypothetical protein
MWGQLNDLLLFFMIVVVVKTNRHLFRVSECMLYLSGFLLVIFILFCLETKHSYQLVIVGHSWTSNTNSIEISTRLKRKNHILI